MVVVAPVVYLATSALAIALTALNVARNEAQQAVEAAALAGAKVFGETGLISGKASQAATVQTLARQRAIAVGVRKKVGGQTVALKDSDVTFNSGFSLTKSLIAVIVQRAAGCSPVCYLALKTKLIGMVSFPVMATSWVCLP